jgi:hypothetical protein
MGQSAGFGRDRNESELTEVAANLPTMCCSSWLNYLGWEIKIYLSQHSCQIYRPAWANHPPDLHASAMVLLCHLSIVHLLHSLLPFSTALQLVTDLRPQLQRRLKRKHKIRINESDICVHVIGVGEYISSPSPMHAGQIANGRMRKVKVGDPV